MVAAVVIALGLTGGGWLIGRGFVDARSGDRFVSVKGVAEQAVKADLALWPLRFVATGNTLEETQGKIVRDGRTIADFLASAGIGQEAVEVQGIEVTDLFAQAYRSGPVENRFIVAQTLMVRTADVDRISGASQKIGDLVAAGVVLSSEGQQGPFYVFTKLNDVKPAMIAEATRNARQGAEQFAQDSASRVGGIRRASQGVFQILPRDDAPGQFEPKQVQKTVRVVSTVDYLLVD
jgi:hypothetical protein